MKKYIYKTMIENHMKHKTNLVFAKSVINIFKGK